MSGHTPGRLVVQPLDDDEYAASIMQSDGDPYPLPIADVYSEANARRLVACWNVLDGIPTNEIESAERGGSIASAYNKLLNQRDELLEACKDALGCMIILQEKHPELWDLNSRTWNTAKLADTLGAAITKATGGTA